jgi:cellulose synthase/poly-beta-1,6-N-acetylglucosamine synthase-like glycosyltransferase
MTAPRVVVALVFALYATLVMPLLFWPTSISAIALLGYALYACLALGLACELAETLLALMWPKQVPPCTNGSPPRDVAAVVMTTCDDWTERSLGALAPLAHAGYSVFVLDDSTQHLVLPSALKSSVTVLRRESRRGAKGGNLNHWLCSFGGRFDYAIVLDADSSMSVRTADTLLRIAEHPANRDVAIVQAKTEPDSMTSSTFARAIGVVARSRMRVLDRVHGRLGLLLSMGHNQLLRLGPVSAVGGFDEVLTNEDTVLSLQLAARGWRCVLADAWSYDTDPDTVAAHNRRTVRWARQTLELFKRDWRDVPLPLKILLCRHLLMYLVPLLGACLLALSLWTGPTRPEQVLPFLVASLGFERGFELFAANLWLSISVVLSLLVGRVLLARSEGLAWSEILRLALVAGAPYPSLIVPLAAGLTASLLGRAVRFIPTRNRRALAGDASVSSRALQGLAASMLLTFLVAGAVTHPGSLLVGFNLLWLAFLFVSPVSLVILNGLDLAHNRRTAALKPKAAWFI